MRYKIFSFVLPASFCLLRFFSGVFFYVIYFCYFVYFFFFTSCRGDMGASSLLFFNRLWSVVFLQLVLVHFKFSFTSSSRQFLLVVAAMNFDISSWVLKSGKPKPFSIWSNFFQRFLGLSVFDCLAQKNLRSWICFSLVVFMLFNLSHLSILNSSGSGRYWDFVISCVASLPMPKKVLLYLLFVCWFVSVPVCVGPCSFFY